MIFKAACPLLHYLLSMAVEEMKYKRIGESTEVALRVLVEKIGLTDVDIPSMGLDREGRASFCNTQWENSYEKVQAPSVAHLLNLPTCDAQTANPLSRKVSDSLAQSLT